MQATFIYARFMHGLCKNLVTSVYSLPSLVEAVITALAELFCLSDFIVSLRLAETIKGPYRVTLLDIITVSLFWLKLF